jgi:Zn-dependent protease
MFNPLGFLILIISITVHEFSHSLAADRLGDPTPKASGRLTLNPFALLDLWGMIFMLVVGIGWAKPVPIDQFNLKNPKTDQLIIALSGPASNLILALLGALLIRILPLTFFSSFLAAVVELNVALAIFNLTPVFPLDGFHIVEGLLNDERRAEWHSLEKYGIVILLLLLFPIGNSSALLNVINPIREVITKILLPGGII